MECLSIVLLEDGWRFLYRKQHEQQKHETKVIINRAAAAPTTIPMYTVKLQKNTELWIIVILCGRSNFRSMRLFYRSRKYDTLEGIRILTLVLLTEWLCLFWCSNTCVFRFRNRRRRCSRRNSDNRSPYSISPKRPYIPSSIPSPRRLKYIEGKMSWHYIIQPVC